jgi:hypothetical protein
MRIDFSIDGGIAVFPGLQEPITIDCDTLPPEQRTELQRLIDGANLFAQHQRTGAPKLADARRYTIGVVEGKRRCRITVSEPIEDDAMRALISKLRGFARSVRRR